jgi:hypothetical protein
MRRILLSLSLLSLTLLFALPALAGNWGESWGIGKTSCVFRTTDTRPSDK